MQGSEDEPRSFPEDEIRLFQEKMMDVESDESAEAVGFEMVRADILGEGSKESSVQ